MEETGKAPSRGPASSADILSQLVKDKKDLPSPPSIVIKLIEAVKKDSYEELARLISMDPVLALKVLKMANSPLFARQKKVESLETAISLLGTEMLSNLALSFVLVRNMRRKTDDEFDFESFWRRAVTAAISAKLIASRKGLSEEKLYLAGLLMDIGILAMYICRPEDYLKVFDEKRTGELSTIEAERKVFGFDHATLGAELIRAWKLPEFLSDLIFYHHRPYEAPEEIFQEVQAIFLADRIAGIYFSFRALDKYNFIVRQARKELGFEGEEAESLVDETAKISREVLDLFELPAPELKPYSEILEEANYLLKKLTLNYTQLLQKLREEKARAEALARKLKEANQKLREMAIRDPLTGLYNRRYFQERFQEEMSRAKRYRQPLTVVLADIDHFKRINDTYGHLFGDEVLKEVARVFRERIRKSDLVARYGGEEFVFLLPNTHARAGAAFAERIRREVENLEIKFMDQVIKVTISLGVATLVSFEVSEPEFLNMADKALYLSKERGRNRVTTVEV